MENNFRECELFRKIEFLKLEILEKPRDVVCKTQELVDKIAILEKEIFLDGSYTKSQIEEMLNNKSYSIYIAVKDKREIISYMITLDSIDVEEVIKIGTLKEYRGTGVSVKLFEKLLMNELKNIILEVRESNIQGIRFYEKNGFKIISKRKNYYSDNNETALIMFLERARGN